MTASSRTFDAQRRAGRQPFVEAGLDLVGDQLPADREDPSDELVSADGPDGRQETRRERVVVRRKGDLRVGGHVVEMPRPADAVADGPPIDEARGLEGAELLEDAGPARPERDASCSGELGPSRRS